MADTTSLHDQPDHSEQAALYGEAASMWQTVPHWSEDPALRSATKETFRSLPPKAWDVTGWVGGNYVHVTIDTADAHRLIAEILRVRP